MKKSLYIGGFLLLASMAGGCSMQNLNTNALLTAGMQAAQAMTITDAQMANYIHQYVEQMDQQNNPLPASDPYSVRLSQITSGITEVDGTPLNFKVYKTNEVNAFACADGSVRVYTGLLDLMTDDEVMGVIGHEIGHVAHHDTKNAFKQALMNTALRNTMIAGGGTLARLSSSQLGDLGDQLLQSKFSRSQESDADAYGYEFLKKNGKNPTGMLKSLEKLQQVEGTEGRTSSQMKKLFATHPDLSKRIQDLKKRMEKDGIKKMG